MSDRAAEAERLAQALTDWKSREVRDLDRLDAAAELRRLAALSESNAIDALNYESRIERLQAENDALRAMHDAAPTVEAEPVAWMDDFGNAFPLAANKGAGSWLDEHKRNWKPLYTHPAAPQPAALTQFADELREALDGLVQAIDAYRQMDGANPPPSNAFDKALEHARAVIAESEAQLAQRVPPISDETVSRFLAWPLPKDFYPDCGISFDGRKDDEWNKNKTWPTGTNLLTADQARAMLRHVLCIGQSEGGTT